MINPETDKNYPSSMFIDIDLPVEAEDDWCSEFTETYGKEGLRVMLQAPYFIAQQLSVSCNLPARSNSWEMVWLTAPQDSGEWVDGVVTGARIVPIQDPGDDYFQYVPHAVLKDVSLVDGSMALSDNPEAIIWVPILTSEGKLTCYH